MLRGGFTWGVVPLLLAGIGVMGWVAAGGWRLAAGKKQNLSTQHSALSTQHSKLETRNSKLDPPVGFLVTLAGLSLAFIFGTPLYALLYYGLPFINQLHSPFRWVFPFSLCIAILAGYGLDTLRTTPHAPRTTLHVSRLILASGILTLLALLGSRLFYSALEPLVDRVFHGLALADTAFGSAAAFYSYTFWQVLWLGVVLVVAGVCCGLCRGGQGHGQRQGLKPPAMMQSPLKVG